jgi:hypothetical protein
VEFNSFREWIKMSVKISHYCDTDLSEIVRGRQKSQNKYGEIPLPSFTLVFSTLSTVSMNV